MKLHTLMLALFIGLFLIACDNAEPNNPAPTPSEPTTTTAPAPATPPTVPTVDDRNEVEKAADEVGNAADEIKGAAESVKGAKDALEDASFLFRSGLANYLEVITAQREALESELNLESAKMRIFSAEIELYRSLGGGWK